MTDWLEADWPAPPGVRAGTTRRGHGVSSGPYESLNLAAHVGDSEAAVRENRRRFVAGCRLPAEPQWLEQVHGAAVVRLPCRVAVPPADAAVTSDAGVTCAVLTADCLPVVLARRDGLAIGIAHAGWRGLSAGVIEATVRAMGEPQQLLAWLGPCIGQDRFEVGGEVREAFLARDAAAEAHFRPNEAGRWQADLYGLARLRLAAAGVDEVHGGGACTHRERERYFSYRRDGECGRMAAFVVRD